MKKIIIFILGLLSFTLVNLQLIFAEDEYDELDDYVYTSGSFNNELLDITEFNSMPTITILTPGLSSNASTWGMNTNSHSVDDYSIISYLHRRGADVYLANQIISSSEDASKEIFDASTLSSIRISQLFSGSVATVENLSMTSKSFNNKSIVIVFNPYMANEGHDIYGKSSNNGLAYYELESVVNAIIYKYMIDNPTNPCPKINMIGHSRGGILNMLYALQHPNVVDTLASVGTPYNGSNLGEIDGSMQAIKFFTTNSDDTTSTESSEMLSNENPDCITDVLNSNSNEFIKNLWNDYQKKHNTKLITVGSSMTFSLIKQVFNKYTSEMFTGTSCVHRIGRNILEKFNNLLSSDYRYLHSSCDLIDKFNLDADLYREESFINNINYNLDFYQLCISIINIFRSIAESEYNQYLDCIVCCQKPCTCLDDEKLIINIFNNLIKYISINSVYDQTIINENGNGDFVLLDDFYIDLSSQLAEGYNGAIQYEKVFDINNCDLTRLSYGNSPYIGHNMEQQDQDIIRCILTNMSLGPNDNGFVVSEENEIIGFNTSKAIDNNGTMKFSSSNFSSTKTYILSEKIFGKDYNLAQVSKDNNSYTFESTSHISEIIFENVNLIVEENAFAFLQDQVHFDIINSNLYNDELRYFVDENALFSQRYNSTDEYYYGERTLVKYGRGEYINSFPTVTNCDIIGKGAFFCQPILDVKLSCSVNEIKDYAFYGCTNLRKVDYEEDVNNELTSIGKFVIDNTQMYNESEIVVVLNYIFKYDNAKILQTSKYNNLKGIAPGAFKNNDNHLKIVFDTEELKILSNAFNGNFISNVIIIEEPNYDIDSFVNIYKLNGEYTFNLYSPYENIEFLDVEAKSQFQLDIKYFDGTGIDNCIVNFDLSKPCYVGFSVDNYSRNGKQCVGFNTEKSRELIENLYHENDFFEIFDNEIFVYLSCAEHSINDSNHLQITEEDNEHHLVSCDDCNYFQFEKHIMNSTCINSLSHISQCVFCTYNEEEEHTLQDEYDKYVDCVKHKKVCVSCDYTEYCQNQVYMSLSGFQHTITCTDCYDCNVYEDHLYISMNFENMCINVCLFCDFHICNGIIGYADNDGHSLLCQYCGVETNSMHYFIDNQTFTNANEDVLFGYHYRNCSICDYEVHEQHSYELQEDKHRHICLECDAEYIYQHQETVNLNITSSQHVSYCEFCNVYYRENHSFGFYDCGLVNEQGHQKICSDCGYVIDVEHIFAVEEYDSNYHQNVCTICSYIGCLENHTLMLNCLSSDVNEHYRYCTDCSFEQQTLLEYESLHEYEHIVTCMSCNNNFVENHAHNCESIDGELHCYRCYYCEVEYEMPHYVNDQYIIYYYDEVYYKIVCLYCGYSEYKMHESENCPCESC